MGPGTRGGPLLSKNDVLAVEKYFNAIYLISGPKKLPGSNLCYSGCNQTAQGKNRMKIENLDIQATIEKAAGLLDKVGKDKAKFVRPGPPKNPEWFRRNPMG